MREKFTHTFSTRKMQSHMLHAVHIVTCSHGMLFSCLQPKFTELGTSNEIHLVVFRLLNSVVVCGMCMETSVDIGRSGE